MSLSNKKIVLISISIFAVLLAITLYIDVQNGVFNNITKANFHNKNHYNKRIQYSDNYNTYNQVSKVKNINRSYNKKSSSPVLAKSRMLTDNEINISRIKTKYLKYIEYSLRLNWKNPTEDNTLSSAYTIFIEPSGKVSGYYPLKTSSSNVFNNAVLDTISKTVPFYPLPSAFDTPEGIALQVYFNGEEVQASAISSRSGYVPYPLPYNKTEITTPEISETKDLRMQSRIDSRNYPHFQIAKQIQSNWTPPLDRNSFVIVNFKLHKNGSVENITIDSSTGDIQAEKAALKAIKALKLNNYKNFDERGFVNINYKFEVVDNI